MRWLMTIITAPSSSPIKLARMQMPSLAPAEYAMKYPSSIITIGRIYTRSAAPNIFDDLLWIMTLCPGCASMRLFAGVLSSL